ncbi:sensor histidine kinase [Streptomyces sp. NBC_00096]|uniref:sensor histidine kinase n=1 Tax=Streptomyces sp. NBC_00096 TaxID=2975650 RepID=UPI00325153E7
MSVMGRSLLRAAAEAFGGGVLVLAAFRLIDQVGGSLPAHTRAALTLVALALFVVRRRCPEVALLGMGALLGVMSCLGVLMAVTAYTVSHQLAGAGRRAAVLFGAGALTVLTAGASVYREGFGSWQYGLTLGAVLAAVAVFVPGLVGASAGQQQRLLAALRERAAAAEENRRLAESESRIHERSRIAAEMHDLVGHRLSLISLHAGGLEMALRGRGGEGADELRESANQVRTATRDAMHELREALGVLGPLSRDTGTDALTDATGTRADIEALVAESRAVGVPVGFDWTGPDTQDREARVRRAVHRVVREALTNVHRYAAGAPVEVRIEHTADSVTVRVANGAPVRPPAAGSAGAPAAGEAGLGTGRGLSGLRERVALLGGDLTAGPDPAGGFAVRARLPAVPPTAAQTDAERAKDRTPGPAGAAARRLRRAPLLIPLAQAASGLLGLAGIGATLMFGLQFVGHARPLSYSPPRPPEIGMSRQQVEGAGVYDERMARAAAAGHEPPRPPDAGDCVYPFSRDTVGRDRLELTRYCFRGEILIQIIRFEVPMVPVTASPSPSPSPTPSGSARE